MVLPTEEDIIELLRNHYRICTGKPTPLAAIRQRYGKQFKFQHMGLGKFVPWLTAHRHLFESEMIDGRMNASLTRMMISEDDLLEDVKAFFAKSPNFGHRRQVLSWLRTKYGPGPFAQFGYGSFPEFLARHGLAV